MNQKPSSKIVLITGCSSGFGLLTATYLAQRNYQVIATMRNLAKKNTLISELNKHNVAKEGVDILQLDVTDQASIHTAINYIASKFGYVDVLVNNAGYGIGGAFEDLTEKEIREQMETNFFGVQNVTRCVIPMMRQRKQGKIINISSVAGFSSSPCFSAYNASKWALEGFSESLRYELKFFGIDVLLIEPGTYKTPIFYDNRRYAHNFDNTESPYYEISQHLKKKVMDYVEDCYKDLMEVPMLVEKLIRSKKPSFRNIPDVEAKSLSFLRKILPFRVYSWIVEQACFHKLYQGQKKRETA